jgi:hypothetical protein
VKRFSSPNPCAPAVITLLTCTEIQLPAASLSIDMQRRRRKEARSRGRSMKAIPPSAPAARDEGPRLIPLAPEKPQSPSVEHYIGLAEVALSHRKWQKV